MTSLFEVFRGLSDANKKDVGIFLLICLLLMGLAYVCGWYDGYSGVTNYG